MGFKCGIIGLPNVGKSSLFNALVGLQKAASENYPFCTIEPNIGKVPVPDSRLKLLAQANNSKNVINGQMEFVDIAGLVKGASKGEGLGNKFLSNIREVDAIAHVVRCFEDKNITHVHNNINPEYDIEIIESELLLSDLERVDNIISKLKKLLKVGKKEYEEEYELFKKVYEDLSTGNIKNKSSYKEDERYIINKNGILSFKPLMYVANLDEESMNSGNIYSKGLKAFAEKKNIQLVTISAKIEEELSAIKDEAEKKELMQGLSIKSNSLDQFISIGFNLLNLITYFTSGEKETKAWTILKDSEAPKAAGAIHSDFEKGFIAAEVINYKKLLELGSEKNAKVSGKIRTEGKDYIVKDGDVILFRFNV
jgi:ribosome-binding ATPase